MPPKKKDEPEKTRKIMGRMGTNLQVGIVGLPNVGKSTFFNVLTKSSISADNFPFCTIDPNESRVAVPDARFDFLCEYHKPVSRVPAWLKIMDIAGLVEGASQGEGLGNAFLSHIKSCDAIFHMLRAFEDKEVIHVKDEVNPINDILVIMDELRLKDEEYLNKKIDALERVKRGGDKAAERELQCLHKVKTLFEEKKPVRFGKWDSVETEILNNHLFITSKPMVYLVNLSVKDYIRKKNKWLPEIKKHIDEHDPGSALIPYSAAFEAKIADMDDESKAAYLEENKIASALDKIITTGYKSLGLIYFFTAGHDEVKAWTIQEGYKAPQAAGKIHTDFEKGFIMAEVYKYEDFKEHGSEQAVKDAGKYRQKGRDYVVEDGDIMFIKANAGAGLGGAAAKKK